MVVDVKHKGRVECEDAPSHLREHVVVLGSGLGQVNCPENLDLGNGV